MTTQPLRIDIKGAVPIPVGHLVEVWLLRASGGFLNSDAEGPMVRHVETGIVYGPSWAYRKEGGAIQHTAPSQLDLHESVTITARWAGRILHCRIAATQSDNLDQVTTLIVNPTADAPPYR